MVADAGDDFGFVRVVIGKYEDKAGKKVPANITLAAVIPITDVMTNNLDKRSKSPSDIVGSVQYDDSKIAIKNS